MRWMALALIALLAAGCGSPIKTQPGSLAFSQTGAQAALTYKLGGKVRYRLTCREGGDRVELQLEPRPSANRPIKLRTGRGKSEIRLRLWAISPEGGLPFHLQDGFMVRLLWDGTMTVNGRRFDLGRDRDILNARWRFQSTCFAALPDGVITGDPTPRSLHDQLSALKVENAAADARRALSRGDRRFASVTGYSRSVPGVEGVGLPELGAYRDVDPTGDVTRSPDQRAFKMRARRYAEIYNRTLLAESR